MSGEMTIVAGVVAWAIGMVSWLVIRNDRNNQRSLDCLMALVNKEAAVISTGVGRARKQPQPDKKELKQQRDLKRRKTELESVVANIEATGVMDENDMRDLEKLNGR